MEKEKKNQKLEKIIEKLGIIQSINIISLFSLTISFLILLLFYPLFTKPNNTTMFMFKFFFFFLIINPVIIGLLYEKIPYLSLMNPKEINEKIRCNYCGKPIIKKSKIWKEKEHGWVKEKERICKICSYNYNKELETGARFGMISGNGDI